MESDILTLIVTAITSPRPLGNVTERSGIKTCKRILDSFTRLLYCVIVLIIFFQKGRKKWVS